MTTTSSITHTGGRDSVRRFLVAAVVIACVALPGARLTAAADPAPSPEVTVRETRGTYSVTARFEVPQSAAVALAVLSDYEQIPRFMPGVRTSVVRERTPERVMVEQEAVSQFMMFSKTVHLLLDVTEDRDTIRFVDRSGKSFSSYEGSWQAVQKDGGTTITYELTARPAFDVPEFILKRLLKRDSAQMINCLRREIAARAVN
jgi:ribosome-associated toxin RatA of RatAB toxin-antitoxin module